MPAAPRDPRPARPPTAPAATGPPDPVAIERAAADAWRGTIAVERGGWLLRAAPRVAHRRTNSALPLAPDADVAVVERFYAAQGLDPLVAVAPAEDLRALDASLAAAGWAEEGHTDVLVARRVEPASLPPGVEPVDPLAWPNEAVREEVLARARGDVLAFAEGQRGAVICIRSGELAGIFRLHVAPAARRLGVGSRLVAACATVAPVLYAQVEVENAAAHRLFARAGFTRSHGYHYRRRAGRVSAA